MNLWKQAKLNRTSHGTPFECFRAFSFLVLIHILGTLLPVGRVAAQDGLPRNALWALVHDVCVPGQSQLHNPRPCLLVNLNGGMDKGFAILKDPRGPAQFLLIPTARISGIESPALLVPDAANYFADAWDARTFISAAMKRDLPRDGIGMAINSVVGRSQDQLHIHIACVQPNVLESLHRNQEKIGNQWAPFHVPLHGRYYAAIWVSGEDLGSNNPFRLLEGKLADPARDMGNQTLVVIGLTRTDGREGFVVLADQVKKDSGDLGYGEELLDHACGIASVKK
jgi:CDP-diacylglycerol pyrophosphatase